MTNIDPLKCVVCGLDWKDRSPTIHKETGAMSIPIIYSMSLFVNRLKKRVKFVFCDKHGNNHMAYTKMIKGILYVTNTKTRKMQKAVPLGIAA